LGLYKSYLIQASVNHPINSSHFSCNFDIAVDNYFFFATILPIMKQLSIQATVRFLRRRRRPKGLVF